MTNHNTIKSVIKELHSKGLTDISIGNIIGKSVSVVQYHRTNLGLLAWGKLGKYKTCVQCLKTLLVKEFQWKQKSRNHKCSRCKECESEYNKNRRERYRKINLALSSQDEYTIGCQMCSICKVVKLSNEFYRNNTTSTGIRTICKTCFELEMKENYQLYLWRGLKQRARTRNLEFNLVPKDIILTEICPILGVPLVYRGKQHSFNASVDRINNSKGYVKGNIIVISKKANTMKNDASFEQLKSFCSNTLKLLNYIKLNGSLGSVTDVFPDIKLLEG